MKAKPKFIMPKPLAALGLIASDFAYPVYPKRPSKQDYEELYVVHHIELYEVIDSGWHVATLRISNGSRRSSSASTARTYAVDLNGKVFRIGKGPHVLRVITVFVTHRRLKALEKLIALYNHGEVAANVIRDRISSRRAQGAVHRAAGRTSWMW